MSKKRKNQTVPNIEKDKMPLMPPGKIQFVEDKPTLDKYCLKVFNEYDLFNPSSPGNIANLLNGLYKEGWELVETFRELGDCCVLLERIEDIKIK